MAIYKSSYNKKPEKEKKLKQEKSENLDIPKKPKRTVKLNKHIVNIVVFSLVFFVCCLPSNIFKNFILGVFGLSVYPICPVVVLFSILFLQKRKFQAKPKYIAYLVCAEIVLILICHLILTNAFNLPLNSFGSYLSATYKIKTTAGGLIFSLIAYPIIKFLTIVGAYIFSFIALAVFVGLIVDYLLVDSKLNNQPKKTNFDFKNLEALEIEPVKTISKEEQHKRDAKRKLGLTQDETTIISSSMPTINLKNTNPQQPISKREYILTPIDPILPTDDTDDIFLDSDTSFFNSKKVERPQKNNFYSEEIKPNVQPNLNQSATEQIKDAENEESLNNQLSTQPEYAPEISKDNDFDDIFVDNDEDYTDITDYTEDDLSADEQETEELQDISNQEENSSNQTVEEIDADVENSEYVDEFQFNRQDEGFANTVDTEVVRPSVDISKFNLPNIKKNLQQEQDETQVHIKEKQEIPPYVAPPAELLNYLESQYRISDEELQDNIDRLEQVLEDFKVPAKVNNVQVGPAVTRYELTMPRGISVNKIAQMADDIAMTLASNGAIRVEAPIPGKNSVGIEVPNNQVTPVSLRELIDSNEFRVRANPLSFVLGKDINGDIIFCNLDKMPHVLVAGSTGSGKSVCLNTMLLSMCYKAGPQDLRLILVDPKMVEFSTYNGLPHLLIPEVITNKDMTINALDWSIAEMERRYALFAKNRVVNINEFNKLDAVKNKVIEKLPFIVIVVDELADLMLDAKREIEDRIAKLAAKARAAGIHLVLATQRPSVDVITGTVKANLPSRIAFALTNYMDSKTVLDGGGAEKLLGKGDMLFKPQDKPEPRRVQGAFVSNSEITKVVEFIKQNNKPVYDDDAGKAIKNPHQNNSQVRDGNVKEQEFDPVLKDALRLFIQNKQASGSMISRRYSVGFNRAGRIMDQMEQAGFIGPQEGSKPRQVLITMEEYLAIFGDDDK